MIRRPPRSTRTDTLFPYTTLFRSLRRYLEYFAGEASHRLRAAVEFRGDGEFMLGDTLPAATSALGTAFKSAKAAANSWGQADVVATIRLLEVPFAASKATRSEDSRVGKECVITDKYRWWPSNKKN